MPETPAAVPAKKSSVGSSLSEKGQGVMSVALDVWRVEYSSARVSLPCETESDIKGVVLLFVLSVCNLVCRGSGSPSTNSTHVASASSQTEATITSSEDINYTARQVTMLIIFTAYLSYPCERSSGDRSSALATYQVVRDHSRSICFSQCKSIRSSGMQVLTRVTDAKYHEYHAEFIPISESPRWGQRS
jgi:hypothetical protein